MLRFLSPRKPNRKLQATVTITQPPDANRASKSLEPSGATRPSSLLERLSSLSLTSKILNIPPLPEDVIEIVFYHLFPDQTFSSPDVSWGENGCQEPHTKAYLAQFCLLSHAWLNPTRRILYRTITHSYNHQTKAPLLWDIINNFAQIRSYILRLHITPSDAHNILLKEIGTLLPRCTIFLTIPSEARSPDLVMSLNCIGYLRAGWNWMEGYTRDMWLSAFMNWTRLEALHIYSNPRYFPFELADQEGAFLPSLRVLRLRMLRNLVPFPPTSRNTLHTVCLSSIAELKPELLLMFLSRHSQSLHRLHIAYVRFNDDTPNSILNEAVSQLAALESLIIVRVDGYLVDSIYSVLPETLTDISLVVDHRWPPNYVVFRNFVLSSRTNFRMITIDLEGGDSRSMMGKKWAPLVRSSKERTVQVLFNPYSSEHAVPPWAQF